MSVNKVKVELFSISINNSTIRSMETILRRSTRVRAKEESGKKGKYIEHIKTLHSVAGDLLIMTDVLSEEDLRKVIGGYENLIGDILNIK
jgi:hypothetical protein|tara:strand:- start:66 stop:335 length:270 start_codon:yes stop_codon:yes gene_type:complete